MDTAPAAGKKARIPFIELLRVIACFLVIVNHTNSKLFLFTASSVTRFFSLTYFFVSKAAVPVFLMVSGYTMLNRQDSHRKAFLRFLRFAACLVLFSGFYYVTDYWAGDIDTLSLKSFLRRIIDRPITKAYWYLYLYLGMILMMPFLQKLVSTFRREDFHVFFFWSGLFFSVWPIAAHYIPGLAVTEHFALPLFDSYICLLLLGCYMRRYAVPSKKWRLISAAGFFSMCLLSVLLTYGEYIRNDGVDYLFFGDRVLLPVVLSGVCLFYWGTTLRLEGRVRDAVIFLGQLTFGVYLVSDFLIRRFEFVFPAMRGYGVPAAIAMVSYETLVFAVGALAVWVLRKIPGLRTLL